MVIAKCLPCNFIMSFSSSNRNSTVWKNFPSLLLFIHCQYGLLNSYFMQCIIIHTYQYFNWSRCVQGEPPPAGACVFSTVCTIFCVHFLTFWQSNICQALPLYIK